MDPAPGDGPGNESYERRDAERPRPSDFAGETGHEERDGGERDEDQVKNDHLKRFDKMNRIGKIFWDRFGFILLILSKRLDVEKAAWMPF